MIKLGSLVRDRITGFEGIAIARVEYLTGCTQIGVKSRKLHDGKTINASYFDEPQLEVISEGEIIISEDEEDKKDLKKNGGPKEHPSKY